MAVCKICGIADGSKPDLVNWDCPLCFREELSGSDGTIEPNERYRVPFNGEQVADDEALLST